MIVRPTHKELSRRLAEAKEAVASGNVAFAVFEKAVGELFELRKSAEDVWELIGELLEEIDPSDYAGSRPPKLSYEDKIEGRELFAFAWKSKFTQKQMYLKFAVMDGTYYYVSLHRDRMPKGE